MAKAGKAGNGGPRKRKVHKGEKPEASGVKKKTKQHKPSSAKDVKAKQHALLTKGAKAKKLEVVAGAAGPGLPGAAAVGDLQGWPALDMWLRRHGASFDDVEVRNASPSLGLGVFARKDIAAGGVAFSVPAKAMLTAKSALDDDVVARLAKLIGGWGAGPAAPELLLCLRLCRARKRAEDPFHTYAASLPEDAPGAAAWPALFKEFLLSTSLKPALKAADEELDGWEALVQRAAKEEPAVAEAIGAFGREALQWARGMLQSRGFPAGFSGAVGDNSLCMVPFLDILNHKSDADLSIKVQAGRLDFVCDGGAKKGAQVWNNYGAKANAELIMQYGFTIDHNPEDFISLPLVPAVEGQKTPAAAIKLSGKGIPEEVIDWIENQQDTAQFVALLQALLQIRRDVTAQLGRLPGCLNYEVCKGGLARAHKEAIKTFLEEQVRVIGVCLHEMQSAGDKEMEEEEEVNEDSEAEIEIAHEMLRKKKRRRHR